MKHATPESNSPKKRSWLKWLGWCFASLVVLVAAIYWFATSNAFFQRFVLPRLGAALQADLSVGNAEISPFSRVVLHDLTLTPQGGDTVLRASSITAHYDLISILHGKFLMDELSVVDPTVIVIENPDGTSNLDPLLKSNGSPAKQNSSPAPPSSMKSSEPPAIDLKTISVRNATVRYVENLKNGTRRTIELSNVNATANDIRNSGTGNVTFNAAIAENETAPITASNSAFQATADAKFAFELNRNLKPGGIEGTAEIRLSGASGQYAELSSLSANFDCNVTPTEIKRCILAFARGGAALGNVSVGGPFDPSTMEGKLKVDVFHWTARF